MTPTARAAASSCRADRVGSGPATAEQARLQQRRRACSTAAAVDSRVAAPISGAESRLELGEEPVDERGGVLVVREVLADHAGREVDRERADLGAERLHGARALGLDLRLRLRGDARGLGRRLLTQLGDDPLAVLAGLVADAAGLGRAPRRAAPCTARGRARPPRGRASASSMPPSIALLRSSSSWLRRGSTFQMKSTSSTTNEKTPQTRSGSVGISRLPCSAAMMWVCTCYSLPLPRTGLTGTGRG